MRTWLWIMIMTIVFIYVCTHVCMAPFPVLMELHGSVIQHIHRVALKANVGLLIP